MSKKHTLSASVAIAIAADFVMVSIFGLLVEIGVEKSVFWHLLFASITGFISVSLAISWLRHIAIIDRLHIVCAAAAIPIINSGSMVINKIAFSPSLMVLRQEMIPLLANLAYFLFGTAGGIIMLKKQADSSSEQTDSQ